MNAQIQPASLDTPACALHCADVAGRSSPAWWPDVRVFTVALTRRYFRELPLRFVMIPALDAPVLSFPWSLEAQAEVWRAELVELRQRYAKAFTVDARVSIARRARRVHLVRVAAADGYTWPGAGGCYSVEFAE